jgi:hypothetical protein
VLLSYLKVSTILFYIFHNSQFCIILKYGRLTIWRCMSSALNAARIGHIIKSVIFEILIELKLVV